jgi:predicted AAA+ superfamily ATPase
LTYVKEEIAAEQIVRRLDPFRNFLEIAAQGSGLPVNFANIARDAGADPKTVQSYYQILEDTLVGFTVRPWHRSLRKQQSQAPRFYFFDLGVKRAFERMLEVPVSPRTYAYGNAFEHFLIAEIHRLADYAGLDWKLCYLRTNHGAEIDLVIDRPGRPPLFLEIKSADQVDERDTRSLEAFLADAPEGTEGMLLSQCETAKRIGRVLCLPWRRGLEEMGL